VYLKQVWDYLKVVTSSSFELLEEYRLHIYDLNKNAEKSSDFKPGSWSLASNYLFPWIFFVVVVYSRKVYFHLENGGRNYVGKDALTLR